MRRSFGIGFAVIGAVFFVELITEHFEILDDIIAFFEKAKHSKACSLIESF